MQIWLILSSRNKDVKKNKILNFSSPLDKENVAPYVTTNQIYRQLHEKPSDY